MTSEIFFNTFFGSLASKNWSWPIFNLHNFDPESLSLWVSVWFFNFFELKNIFFQKISLLGCREFQDEQKRCVLIFYGSTFFFRKITRLNYVEFIWIFMIFALFFWRIDWNRLKKQHISYFFTQKLFLSKSDTLCPE